MRKDDVEIKVKYDDFIRLLSDLKNQKENNRRGGVSAGHTEMYKGGYTKLDDRLFNKIVSVMPYKEKYRREGVTLKGDLAEHYCKLASVNIQDVMVKPRTHSENAIPARPNPNRAQPDKPQAHSAPAEIRTERTSSKPLPVRPDGLNVKRPTRSSKELPTVPAGARSIAEQGKDQSAGWKSTEPDKEKLEQQKIKFSRGPKS